MINPKLSPEIDETFAQYPFPVVTIRNPSIDIELLKSSVFDYLGLVAPGLPRDELLVTGIEAYQVLKHRTFGRRIASYCMSADYFADRCESSAFHPLSYTRYRERPGLVFVERKEVAEDPAYRRYYLRDVEAGYDTIVRGLVLLS